MEGELEARQDKGATRPKSGGSMDLQASGYGKEFPDRLCVSAFVVTGLK